MEILASARSAFVERAAETAVSSAIKRFQNFQTSRKEASETRARIKHEVELINLTNEDAGDSGVRFSQLPGYQT